MAVAAKPALTSKFFPFSPPKTRSPPTKLKPHFKKSKIIVSALLTSHQSDSSAEEAPLFSQNGKVSSGTENNPFLKMGLKPSKTRVFDDSVFERVTVKDYMDRSKDLIKHDGGPPRWFSPIECGRHLENAPLMLFLPGIEGVGLGLLLHHQRLGKIFDVWCLHIPVQDRTPFEGLVEFVERTVKSETSRSPNRPIYLVGDSFGGCLALSVAARNPDIDLILILVNPATSFNKLQLQPLFQLLEFVPDELHVTIPYFLSFITGDPVRMAMANVDEGLPLKQTIEKLSETLTTMLPCLSGLADILPKKSLLWKLRMLRSASSFANSRLHAIKAQTLILASGKDQLLPSQEEAKRLCAVLPNSRIRHFKDSGHSILLEGGINLATIIKGAGYYRRSRHMDFVSDYQPPTFTEFQQAYQSYGWVDHVTSPVVLSTLEDGKIVRGLAGIPHEGPVMLVGYHMLMGWEVTPLVREFLIERDILVRGVAHPFMFDRASELLLPDSSSFDPYRLMGAVPVSATNLFKLLSRKSFVLLYPGGAREALHRKGEGYKLFWPEQSEFVRMAARFGATIIPFGVVGVDDICELVLDYDDLMRIPFIKAQIEEINHDAVRLRTEFIGELGNQALHLPGFLPKFPGRFYFLFSKPIETKGRKKELRNKEIAHALYLDLKSQVEKNIAYLREKREKDPYRNLLPRLIYQATHGFTSKIPTFEL